MIIIADSSPLISLSIIKELKLLDLLFEEVLIPEEVLREISIDYKAFSKELEQYFINKVKIVKNDTAVRMLMLEIDKGESEAIILALENGIANILMDDQKGRRVAKREGLKPIGTIGVLLRGKQKRHIKKIKPLLDSLIKNGIHISKELYKEALNIAKEE